jgi:hypothetical protein
MLNWMKNNPGYAIILVLFVLLATPRIMGWK